MQSSRERVRRKEVWSAESGISLSFIQPARISEICTIFLITSLLLSDFVLALNYVLRDEIEMENVWNGISIVLVSTRKSFLSPHNENCMPNIPNNSAHRTTTKRTIFPNIMSFIFVRIYSSFQARWRRDLRSTAFQKRVHISFSSPHSFSFSLFLSFSIRFHFAFFVSSMCSAYKMPNQTENYIRDSVFIFIFISDYLKMFIFSLCMCVCVCLVRFELILIASFPFWQKLQ